MLKRSLVVLPLLILIVGVTASGDLDPSDFEQAREDVKKETVVIEGSALKESLHEVVPEVDVVLLDEKYRVFTRKGGIKEYAERNPYAKFEYTEDFFDCEDYAMLFRSVFAGILHVNSIGFFTNRDHAFNIIPIYDPYTETFSWYGIESQESGKGTFFEFEARNYGLHSTNNGGAIF